MKKADSENKSLKGVCHCSLYSEPRATSRQCSYHYSAPQSPRMTPLRSQPQPAENAVAGSTALPSADMRLGVSVSRVSAHRISASHLRPGLCGRRCRVLLRPHQKHVAVGVPCAYIPPPSSQHGVANAPLPSHFFSSLLVRFPSRPVPARDFHSPTSLHLPPPCTRGDGGG